MQDLRAAVRALVRKPGFALLAIATLALGIGGNAAIFSMIDRVLLRPLPYPRPDRLVVPWEFSAEVQQRTGFDTLPISPARRERLPVPEHHLRRLGVGPVRAVQPYGNGRPRAPHRRAGQHGLLRRAGRSARSSAAPSLLRTLVVRVACCSAIACGGSVSAPIPQFWAASCRSTARQGSFWVCFPSWFRFPAEGDLPSGLGFSGEVDIWAADVLSPAQQVFRGGKSFTLIGRLKDGVDLPPRRRTWSDCGGYRRASFLAPTPAGPSGLSRCANNWWAECARPSSSCSWRSGRAPHRLRERREPDARPCLQPPPRVVCAACAGSRPRAARAADARREPGPCPNRRHPRPSLAWTGLRVMLALTPGQGLGVRGATLDWRVAGFTIAVSALTGLVLRHPSGAAGVARRSQHGLRDGAGHRGQPARAPHPQSAGRGGSRARDGAAGGRRSPAADIRAAVERRRRVQAGGVLTVEVSLPRRHIPAAPRPTSTIASSRGSAACPESNTSPSLRACRSVAPRICVRSPSGAAPARPWPGGHRRLSGGDGGILRGDGDPAARRPAAAAHGLGNPAPAVLVNATMAASMWPGQEAVGRRVKLTGYEQEAPGTPSSAWSVTRARRVSTAGCGRRSTSSNGTIPGSR